MDSLDWFKDKKVTVMGLGFHDGGVGMTKWLYGLGAKVTVTDLGDENKLKDSLSELSDMDIRLVLGRHEEEDFKNADLVVRNPAVSAGSKYLEIARQANVAIEMESSLFFRFSPTRNIVAITGTKGKTTSTYLMQHVLQTAGYDVKLAGNLAKSMVGLIDKLQKDDWLVLELSSFQCEGFSHHVDEFRNWNLGAKFCVLTNLFEDHLNRYAGMQEYVMAKKQLFMVQSQVQYSVIGDIGEWQNLFCKDLVSKLLSVPELEFEIGHYQHKENAALIVSVARKIGISDKLIAEAFANFRPPEHRLEWVRKLDGVDFYNDSTATNPTAAASGIKELAKQNRKIVAIVGGNDKNMEFKPLIDAIIQTQSQYVLLEGSADQKLEELPKELSLGKFNDYKVAIMKAFEVAKNDGIVTLSPGATSFNLFKDEFDRGRQFKEIVCKL